MWPKQDNLTTYFVNLINTTLFTNLYKVVTNIEVKVTWMKQATPSLNLANQVIYVAAPHSHISTELLHKIFLNHMGFGNIGK